MTGGNQQLVIFSLNERLYALYLSAVERVVRAVEITPLPGAPEIVLGAVNVQGKIIPIFDIRKRFRLPEREISLGDHLLIARTSRRMVGLVADAVSGILERTDHEIVAADAIVPGLEYLAGVLKLEGDIILIHDLDRFLSIEEEKTVGQAMKRI